MVFAKKKYPDNWEKKVEEAARKYFEYSPEWDDDKVRAAAEYLVLYMDVRLKPYKVKEKLHEFDKDGGFLF